MSDNPQESRCGLARVSGSEVDCADPGSGLSQSGTIDDRSNGQTGSCDHQSARVSYAADSRICAARDEIRV